MKEKIKRKLEESIAIKQNILKEHLGKIEEIAKLIISSLKKGGKLIIFGNGGSAADSQHIVAELIGRFEKDRKSIPAISLTTNTSIITAIGNDYGFEHIFSKQIEGLAHKNDVVIGISTSGKAKNVLNGIAMAKEIGISTIGLTGKDGGELAKITDISITVPSQKTARIQEAHIAIGHILCALIEEELAV